MDEDHFPEKLAYTISEFSKATTISRTKIYQLIKDGTLVPKKIGTKTLITVDEARRFLDGS